MVPWATLTKNVANAFAAKTVPELEAGVQQRAAVLVPFLRPFHTAMTRFIVNLVIRNPHRRSALQIDRAGETAPWLLRLLRSFPQVGTRMDLVRLHVSMTEPPNLFGDHCLARERGTDHAKRE